MPCRVSGSEGGLLLYYGATFHKPFMEELPTIRELEGLLYPSPLGERRSLGCRIPPVIDEHVEVAGRLSQCPQEECNLSAMVNSMDGTMLHEFPEPHCIFWPVSERKLDRPIEIFIIQIG